MKNIDEESHQEFPVADTEERTGCSPHRPLTLEGFCTLYPQCLSPAQNTKNMSHLLSNNMQNLNLNLLLKNNFFITYSFIYNP